MKTIIFLLITIVVQSEDYCRERNRLIESDRNDFYVLIDAKIGHDLNLRCHYCNENDDLHPKIWYKIDKFPVSQAHEVSLDMNNNALLNRIKVTIEHTLIISNFTENDTGLYYCLRLEEQTNDEKYNYLLDSIFDMNVTNEEGSLLKWLDYYDNYFAPLNTLFNGSKGVEFVEIRTLQIEMKLVTRWQPWQSCEVCGRLKGIRRKLGLCRIKLKQTNRTKSTNSDLAFLLNANTISCRSRLLGRLFPDVSNRTKIIPNFEETQLCDGICNPDSEGNMGWKKKKFSFKYKKTIVLAENSHLTLICPESTLDNSVIWSKDGKKLETGPITPENPEEEPRILLDLFNTLYLVAVKKSEEGNYTCIVDLIKMQQITVFVVSKSRLLTQAFLRHFIYLGFILSLTLTCYCAGLIITCSKRATFKGYERLKEIQESGRPFDEDEP